MATTSTLEKELKALRAQVDALQNKVNALEARAKSAPAPAPTGDFATKGELHRLRQLVAKKLGIRL